MTLAVGYLHVGPPEHGVSRYGRLLAAEAQRRAEVCIREVEVTLDGRADDRLRLTHAAQALATTDVVQIQYNSHASYSIWGPAWSQLQNLRTFARHLPVPLAVGVHDIYPPPTWHSIRALARRRVALLVRGWLNLTPHLEAVQDPAPRFGLRAKIRRQFRPDAVTLRWLGRYGQRLLVCTQEEQDRLGRFVPRARVTKIPHFVEERTPPSDRAEAKRVLGLQGKPVVTLLGYIHKRKGHLLLIEAMRELPGNVHVVVAGAVAPGLLDYLEKIQAAARVNGVFDRLHFTGYLSEADLDHYLAATDVAVCPFTDLSASSSLSTWLSAGTPIVASELPQIAEYNEVAPGAIETFAPYTSAALATAIHRVLSSPTDDQRRAITRLRERLHISRVMDAHLEVYRRLQVAGGSSGASGS